MMRNSIGMALAVLLALSANWPVRAQETEAWTPTIVVVKAADSSPVPNPQVRFLDHERVAVGLGEAVRMLLNEDPRALSHSKTATGGQDGRVSLGEVSGRITVACGHDGLWGIQTFDRGPEPKRLPLLPDRGRSAVVKDAQGRPLPGVIVYLHVEGPGRDFGFRRSIQVDAAGRVHFPHVQYSMDGALNRLFFVSLPRSIGFEWGVKGYFAKRFRVETPSTEDDSEPVEVRLPPSGKLAVSIVGPDKQPFQGDVWTGLIVTGSELDKKYPAHHRPFDEEAMTGTGSVVFPVDPGLEIEVVGVSADGEFKQVSKKVDGPKKPGESVEVPLVLAERWPILAGRIVDGDGKPLANKRASPWLWWIENGSEDHTSFRTVRLDHAGRFRLPLAVLSLLKGDEKPTHVELRIGGFSDAEAVARIDLDKKYPPGPTDVGDITAVKRGR